MIAAHRVASVVVTHRASSDRTLVRTIVFLQVAIMLGYPLVAALFALLGFDSDTPSIVYRALICAVSGVVFFVCARSGLSDVPKPLWLFMIIYLIRLIYDWKYAGIVAADTSLLFYVVTVILPVSALHVSATRAIDNTGFAKAMVSAGFIFLIAILAARAAGLGANPWESQGIEADRFMLERLNPISIGNAAATIMLSCLYLLVEARPSPRLRGFAGICLALSAYVLLLGNSRGPIAGLLVAITWFISRKLRRAVYIMPIAVVLISVATLNADLADKVLGRFTVDYLSDGSINERLVSQTAAIDAFFAQPLTGAYYLDPTLGVGFYPHNIVIESGMAVGIIGVSLLIYILLRAISSMIGSFGNRYSLYTMLGIQYIILSLTSGTLFAVDAFYFLIGLPFILGRHMTATRANPAGASGQI